ncbi:hypothetical protein [Rhizobium leguminosarum]|uniref:hypothetical protein n=1 Tax=Rhizobium leguminosarum TaxID=384 RepID=UPI0021BBC336|nr:hypothetical protein [Rhizobium leguminosarum]
MTDLILQEILAGVLLPGTWLKQIDLERLIYAIAADKAERHSAESERTHCCVSVTPL